MLMASCQPSFVYTFFLHVFACTNKVTKVFQYFRRQGDLDGFVDAGFQLKPKGFQNGRERTGQTLNFLNFNHLSSCAAINSTF